MATLPSSPDAFTNAAPSLAAPAGGIATVAFLGVAAGVQMSDRGLGSILSPAIQQTFGVGDALIGALHGIAGILIASALAAPLARLSDRHSRKQVLLGLIAVWAALTALGALAPNFALFFLGRAATGITEFAMIPVIYSLIPDLVEERLRVAANLSFAALMATGASLGFYFGGDLLALAARLHGDWLPAGLEPWRRVLLLLSLLGLPLLLAGLATVDPPRRQAHGAQMSGSDTLLGFARSQARRIGLFIGAAGGLAVAVQAVTPMIAMALQRRFPVDMAHVGHTLGLLTLVSSLGSLLIAGALDRGLRARLGAGARPAIMGVAAALAVPCIALLAVAAEARTALVLVGAFLLTTCVANALIPTMLQDLAPAHLRARCFAVYSFLIAAFCALGPLLSGSISQYLVRDDLLSAIALAGTPVLCGAVVCALAGSLHARRGGGSTAGIAPAHAH